MKNFLSLLPIILAILVCSFSTLVAHDSLAREKRISKLTQFHIQKLSRNTFPVKNIFFDRYMPYRKWLMSKYLKTIPYCLNGGCQDGSLDFVIITRTMFVNSLEDFIQWKIDEFDFKVGVFTLEYIIDGFSRVGMSRQIKNAIHSIKNRLGSKYFLLVGDTEVSGHQLEDVHAMYNLRKRWNIPTGYYCRYGTENYVDVKPTRCEYGLEYTDVYYADADEWDVDGNGTNPKEYYTIMDFEAIVARWPVRTPGEVATITNKIKQFPGLIGKNRFRVFDFESNTSGEEICRDNLAYFGLDTSIIPPPLEAIRDIPMIGSFDSCYQGSDIVFSNILSGLDTENERFIVPNPGIDESYDMALEVKDAILSADYSVMEGFHGSHAGIMIGGREPYNLSDYVRLNTDELVFDNIFPIMDLASCSVGTYYLYTSDSLTEALFKNEKGPAMVVEPLNKYLFYSKLLEGKTIGEAFYPEEKIYTYTKVGDNLFGDPSLVMFESNE